MMAICLKVVCVQFDGRYADDLDISILEYFESVRGITTERQSVTKRSIRDCFRYNKTYFKENGEGFCEKSLLSANASVFEFFCLVRRVQVTRKDILMTHNVMSVNAELRACKYQPATSTIMEEEAMEQKLCMYCLYVREVQSLSIVQHCIAECGPHYAHVSCWKRHFCNNDLRIYETYAWMRNTGQGIIPSVRQAMCCPLEASLVMVNVIDNDGVIQQRFKPPCGSLKPSTWDDIFGVAKERVRFVNAVIDCANRFARTDQQTVTSVLIEDHLPDAFPQDSLSSQFYTL
jgi:hypothetical protein